MLAGGLIDLAWAVYTIVSLIIPPPLIAMFALLSGVLGIIAGIVPNKTASGMLGIVAALLLLPLLAGIRLALLSSSFGLVFAIALLFLIVGGILALSRLRLPRP